MVKRLYDITHVDFKLKDKKLKALEDLKTITVQCILKIQANQLSTDRFNLRFF